MAIDPVCGMTVDPNTTPFKAMVGGVEYYFCSASCQKKFLATPSKFGADSHRM